MYKILQFFRLNMLNISTVFGLPYGGLKLLFFFSMRHLDNFSFYIFMAHCLIITDRTFWASPLLNNICFNTDPFLNSYFQKYALSKFSLARMFAYRVNIKVQKSFQGRHETNQERKLFLFSEAKCISRDGTADLCSIRRSLHIRAVPSSTERNKIEPRMKRKVKRRIH